MATTLSTSDQHDVVLQAPDGSIDFLQFSGITLVGSFAGEECRPIFELC